MSSNQHEYSSVALETLTFNPKGGNKDHLGLQDIWRRDDEQAVRRGPPDRPAPSRDGLVI